MTMPQGDSPERMDLYDFAMRHGMHDPWDFSIMNEGLHGDLERLHQAARDWEARHLKERRAQLVARRDELNYRIELIDTTLKDNEERGF